MTIKRSPRQRGWIYLGSVWSSEATTNNTKYEIRRNPADGSIGCACTGFAIRKYCSHVTAYMADPTILTAGSAGAGKSDALKVPSTPGRMVGANAPDQTVVVGAKTFIVRRAISFGTINPELG